MVSQEMQQVGNARKAYDIEEQRLVAPEASGVGCGVPANRQAEECDRSYESADPTRTALIVMGRLGV
jgi:hypothetical protein